MSSAPFTDDILALVRVNFPAAVDGGYRQEKSLSSNGSVQLLSWPGSDLSSPCLGVRATFEVTNEDNMF